jgi:hypothetical protein
MPMVVEWSEDALHKLLDHRLKKAGVQSQESPPDLSGWIEGNGDLPSVLVRAAKGSPGRLIAAGNYVVHRIGQGHRPSLDDVARLVDREIRV